MKLYVAIWDDRHCNTTAHVFSDAEKAIEWARARCKEMDRFGDYEETSITGWLFNATYSCEGDGIHVIERELDADLNQPKSSS